jgi:hypothetical protein
MTGAATWHGTGSEWGALWSAIGRYCSCEFDEMVGVERTICAAHLMLEDQIVLDHLLQVLRVREWFVRAEWDQAHPEPRDPSV